MMPVLWFIWTLVGGWRGVIGATIGASGAFAAFWLWNTAIDNPAQRRAARADMVRVAELEAAKAETEAQKKIAARWAEIAASEQRQAKAAKDAAARFQASLDQAETESGNLQDQIAELLARPLADDKCTADEDLIRRLRGR